MNEEDGHQVDEDPKRPERLDKLDLLKYAHKKKLDTIINRTLPSQSPILDSTSMESYSKSPISIPNPISINGDLDLPIASRKG
ncbi:unnamed protein product, partial [Dovyalis caffra]